MSNRMKPVLLALLLFVFGAPASAANYVKQARQAASDQVKAITIFVDVNFGGRKDSAAAALTEAHAAFESHGFAVVDVEGYTENGDLQGFFVTYRAERQTSR